MAKPNIGYLLPSGDAYEAEQECMLLFYPKRDEYRRALMGSLDYLATWLAWERDDENRGKDAALSWKQAVEATRECIEMGTCDTMLALLEEIRDNTLARCCDEVDVTDGDQYTDEVEDGVGDVPQNIIDAGYATGAADWAGFDDYKCLISHVMITNMQWQVRELVSHFDTAGAIVGAIASVAAVVAVIFATGGAALILGFAVGVAGVAAVYASLSELGESASDAIADAIATNHDELACAIYRSDGSADAVVDLKAKIDELFSAPAAVLLKNLALGPQLKGLYAGRYDQQDIAQAMDDNGYDPDDYDCECLEPPVTPAGYHPEHPVYDTFFGYLNVDSNIVDYDEGTGILDISVTAGGGGNLEFMHFFDDIAGEAPFYHGYVWEVLDSDSVCQFFAVYNGRLDTWPDERTTGEFFAGYNTNQHGGSTWDDWVALFDYEGNHSENDMDGLRQRNTVNNCAGPGLTHTWQIRIWALVAD